VGCECVRLLYGEAVLLELSGEPGSRERRVALAQAEGPCVHGQVGVALSLQGMVAADG